MLLATEPVPSFQVSTSDVPYPSPSYNSDQAAIRNECGVLFEPTKSAIAKSKVFITVSDDQAAASMRERELIEQSLTSWCSASRIRMETDK